MVTKSKSAKKQVKVGKLKLKKETVKDLTPKDAKKVKGGAVVDPKGYSGVPAAPKGGDKGHYSRAGWSRLVKSRL